MSRWFRFYDEVLDDPKVQELSPDDFRGWVNILCVASRNGGVIPEGRKLAFALRMSDIGAGSLVDRLVIAGLIDRVKGGPNGSTIAPHNWSKRQYKSDSSTERVKRFRKRSEAVSETPPDTEQKQIQNRTEQSAPARLVLVEKVTFPSDGTIEYSRWAGIARTNAPGMDPDRVASLFRGFCRHQGIEYDKPSIEKTFTTFCKTVAKKAANA